VVLSKVSSLTLPYAWKQQSAAQKLVNHWKVRRKIFGKEAFSPMSQMNGALCQEDVDALYNTEFLMKLPPDHEGRTVVYVDFSRTYRVPDRSQRIVRKRW
jgi:uncharacterized protein VirK/YbjX